MIDKLYEIIVAISGFAAVLSAVAAVCAIWLARNAARDAKVAMEEVLRSKQGPKDAAEEFENTQAADSSHDDSQEG